MVYQSKTTMIRMFTRDWSEEKPVPISSRFSVMHAVAVQIASECQMDLMSFSPYSLHEEGEDCNAAVVYVNNGRSLDDILRIMKPLLEKRTPKYWMILDLYEWQGMLDCYVTTRADDETWN